MNFGGMSKCKCYMLETCKFFRFNNVSSSFTMASLGHPQACAYPDVCLRTDSVSGKAPLLGQCIWWMPLPLPLCPKESVRAGGQTLCVSTRPLVPGEAVYRIHRQSLNTHTHTHRGKHRSGGAQRPVLCSRNCTTCCYGSTLPLTLFVTQHSLSPKAGHNKAGRSDFRTQRFEPDTAKMRKMRKAPLTLKKQGSEETPQSKTAENAENAENAADWL